MIARDFALENQNDCAKIRLKFFYFGDLKTGVLNKNEWGEGGSAEDKQI